QLLCLDVCLPETPGAAHDPRAGIQVLRQVRAYLPDIRAVVLTSLADDDLLRREAGEHGVSPEDFVPKCAGLDQMAVDLILRLWRAEREAQRQARLPLSSLPHLPYLQLRVAPSQAGRERLAEVRIFGERWRPRENEGKLLLLLARRPGRSVSKQDIYDTI